MPKMTLAGHPLHVILNDLPMGTLPFAAAMDVMRAATGRRDYADAAYYALATGALGAVAAGAAGAMDYFEIRSGTAQKRTANTHAMLNIGLLGVVGANLFLRRKNRHPGPVGLALSLIGTAGLATSAWYGGHLVYSLGVRVKRAEPLEGAPEVAPATGEWVAAALHHAEKRVVPDSGPALPREDKGH